MNKPRLIFVEVGSDIYALARASRIATIRQLREKTTEHSCKSFFLNHRPKMHKNSDHAKASIEDKWTKWWKNTNRQARAVLSELEGFGEPCEGRR